ncbi:hypothetical protein [Sphingobium abikonense]|uniref:hypothetical protein n=1 Tax=Sphingobium abikonense TaxID=86193 RepID=UPI003513D7E9
MATTHIMLRGVDESGENLIIAREYIAHGFRERAAELATVDLGPRTPAEAAAFQSISDNLFQNAPSPEDVAAQAFDGIRDERFYVFTTTRYDPVIAQRTQSILARENPLFESLMALSKGKADGHEERA